MNIGGPVALAMLVVSVALMATRAVRRGTLGDRAVAMDMLTAVVSCSLLVGAAFTGDAVFLDMALVLGMLGFIASVAVGRFIERRGL